MNNFKSATVEDYANSGRQTVNAYYEHCLNSGMSKEQAIQETSSVSERYLENMQEINEAHENGEIMSEKDIQNSSDAPAENSNVTDNNNIDNDDNGIDNDNDDNGIDNDIE